MMKKILTLLAIAISTACLAQTIDIGPNQYAFRFTQNNNFGLFFNATDSQYEFRDGSANPVFAIKAGNGRLTTNLEFEPVADYFVPNNRYAFRAKADEDYGLFFNATNLSYDFRDNLGDSVFSLGANTGDLVLGGYLKPGFTNLSIPGAIRYSTANMDVEAYVNGQWRSLTEASSGGINDLQEAYEADNSVTADQGSLIIEGTDGIQVTGQLGSGVTPSFGASPASVMYFSPNKGAFRAGFVNDAGWDAPLTGNYTAAFGINTRAIGNSGFAAGDGSQALGNFSTAFGNNSDAEGEAAFAAGSGADALGDASAAFGSSTASGEESFAAGNSSTASGQSSFATGAETEAIGDWSSTFGEGSTASGESSFAAGSGADALGDEAVAFGSSTAGGTSSFAAGKNTNASANFTATFGELTQATGLHSFAAGENNLASGAGTAVFGRNSEASGAYAIASGNGSTASGSSSAGIGSNANASGSASAAFGFNTISEGFGSLAGGVASTASGDGAMAFGSGAIARSAREVAIGSFNTDYTPNSSGGFDENDRLFVIGNGTGSTDRNDALVMLKNGNMGLGTDNPNAKITIDDVAVGENGIRLRGGGNYYSTENWQFGQAQDEGGIVADGDFVMKRVNSPVFSFWNGYIAPVADNSATLGLASARWNTVFAANGTINTSDAREKKNIKEIDYGLETLMKLNPVSYEWKEDAMNMGTKLGFVAQDLLEILPEVVVTHERVEDRETGEISFQEAERMGVFYDDLIPVLTKAIQEQQGTIEEVVRENEDLIDENRTLRSELDELKDRMNRFEQDLQSCCFNSQSSEVSGINTTDRAELGQNIPNPFSETTVIQYYLPVNTTKAIIRITDMSGSPVKDIQLESQSGANQIEFQTQSLAAGTYLYSLFVNGKFVSTKKMMVAR